MHFCRVIALQNTDHTRMAATMRKPVIWAIESDINTSLQLVTCAAGGDGCRQEHPNITSYTAAVGLRSTPIGHVKLHVFDKAAMDIISPAQMWMECRRYDENHFGTKLDKIENYVENEEFLSEAGIRIRQARTVSNPSRRSRRPIS